MLQFSRSSCLIWDCRLGLEEEDFFTWDPPSDVAVPLNYSINCFEGSTSAQSSPCISTRQQTETTLKQTYSQRKCNVRSKIRWLTEFCNSHYLSHFAAFFIVSKAKISIANSCFLSSNNINYFKNSLIPHEVPTNSLSIHKNDPSAGSPTETLLRLHLPLNDKIYTTSLPPPRLLQRRSWKSKVFTGSFNR